MTIKVEKALGGQDWLVKLDDYPVKFRSMMEAVEFAEKLKARIDAPHVLPAA
jgi:hypothetical protein